MNKRCLLFALLLCCALTHVQAQVDYASLKTEKKEDFTEELNQAALLAATSLLSMPLERQNPKRVEAFSFLMRWMTGSPHFHFALDETATNISKGNEDLMVVYLAAMSKYMLENRDKAEDKNAVKLNTVRSVLAYCQSRQLKLSGELKKLNKASEAGELEKYLKL